MYHFGDLVSFQCNFGYVMSGPASVLCTSAGAWNGTVAECHCKYTSLRFIENWKFPTCKLRVMSKAFIMRCLACVSHKTGTAGGNNSDLNQRIWTHSAKCRNSVLLDSGVTRNFVRGRFNKFSWGQRERGCWGSMPLVRGSGGSCNLVQEISFRIVKFS